MRRYVWAVLTCLLLVSPLYAQNSTSGNTIKDPSAGGGVTAGGNTTFTGQNVFTALNTFGASAGAANSIGFNETAGCITWEGSGADGIEGRLCVTNPAGVDKTWTFPDVTGTIALLSGAQTFNNDITMASGAYLRVATDAGLILDGSGGFAVLRHATALTPDSLILAIPDAGGGSARSLHIADNADAAFDFNNGPCGTSGCADPTLIVHTRNQVTGEFTSVQAGAIVGTMTKALTEGAATDVVRVGVVAGVGRGGVIEYAVHANDGTDFQTRGGGAFSFSVQNIGGVETCTMAPAAPDQTNDGNAATISLGTLTYAWTCTSAVDATVDLELNATSSLVQTTLKVDYIVRVYGLGTVAAQ